MNLNMYCVGADASTDGSFFRKYFSIFGNIGIKLNTGIILEFELTIF